jgi:hypothetical protein
MKHEALQSKAYCIVKTFVPPPPKKMVLQSLQISLLAAIAQETQSCNNSAQINVHSTTTTWHYRTFNSLQSTEHTRLLISTVERIIIIIIIIIMMHRTL